jgi:hypothetical protein
MAESITVVKLGGTEGVDFSAICGGECARRRAGDSAEDDHVAFGIHVSLY